jgi:hypothetical protein
LDEPEEYVDFMAKYKDWIAIRRIGIRPGTKPEEIAFHLAGVRALADTKAYVILGINTSTLDSFAESITQGMRKSYTSLTTALSRMGTPEQKKAVEEACPNRELTPLAEIYLLDKVITNVGFDIGISQLAMSRIFPDLKPPKAPGRKPKK